MSTPSNGEAWLETHPEGVHSPRPFVISEARFSGTPTATCPTCGYVVVYWDADDIDPETGVLTCRGPWA